MNADGQMDFIAAIYEGVIFFVEGSKAGWKEPRRIKDSQGRNIVLSLYYDREENEYKNVNRAPKGQEDPGDHLVSAALFDWDDDGDLDLLLGAYGGNLYRQMNEGKAGQPKFTGINLPLTAGNAPFNIPGGLTAPRLVDWNSDGLTDLVCGGFKGGAYLYLNNGKKGAPSFGPPTTLIAKPASSEQGPNTPTKGLYVDPVDYDGDGDLDLIVGAYATPRQVEQTLTSKQKERLAGFLTARDSLMKEMDAAYEQIEKRLASLPKAERNARASEIVGSEPFASKRKRMTALFNKINKLQPRARTVSGIWLYRRK